MSFSPTFQHPINAGEPETFGPIFNHIANADVVESFGPVFQHFFEGTSLASFGPVFHHLFEFDPLGKVRGEQLESPLVLPRALDILEGGETSAPEGCVRYYNDNDAPKWVNSEGTVFGFDLLIPLGAVIPWWPLQGASIPSGFEYCDGTAVSTEGSPYFGEFKPALMRTSDAPGATQRFMRGADTTVSFGAPIDLVVGGSDTHTHTGTADTAGDHRHPAGEHVHSIAVEPDHNHGEILGSVDGETSGAQLPPDGTNIGTLLVTGVEGSENESAHTHFIGLDGSHDHTGLTGTATGSTDTAGDHSHSLSTDSGSSTPAYVELAFIIRVI